MYSGSQACYDPSASPGVRSAAARPPPGHRRSRRFVSLMGALLLLVPAALAGEVGNRRILAIRVQFPDGPSAPSFATVQARQNGAANYFDRFSYGKLNLIPTVTTEAFTMPRNSTFYSNNGGALASDAERMARNAGYNDATYNKIGIYYLSIGLTSHATVGGRRFWIQGANGGATLHEMGHTFGWGHARRWASDNQDQPLSGAGEVRTADYHFMSGGGYDPTPYEKWQRDWIERRGNVTSNGEYSFRLYTFDQRDTDPSLARRTITVSRQGFDQTLWLGYRSRLLDNVSQNGQNTDLRQGLVVYWLRSAGSQAVMADIHAGGGQDNHSIHPGETFSDTAGKVHLTNLGRGGSAPNEYLDVQVNRGGFPGNRPPAPRWDAPRTVAVRTRFRITVTGNDPDGDEVACRWRPTKASPNSSAATTRTYTFNNPGPHTVTVDVSDMKGHTVRLSRSIVAEIGFVEEIGFLRGDVNGDAGWDISDPIFTLLHFFAGGPAPSCLDSADANDDGVLDITDPIYLLAYLFSPPAPPPPPPLGECGADSTADDLTCRSFVPCASAR